MPGKIASWYIGNNDQPWINFFVDTSSVHFYVDEPTCATVALAQDQGNVSGNQVTREQLCIGSEKWAYAGNPFFYPC